MVSRTAAYRRRLTESGYKRLSAFITPSAHETLVALRARYPALSVDTILSRLLEGRMALPGDGERALPGDGERALPGDGERALPGDSPICRGELAAIGHRWRDEGLSVSAIAERFNARDWTPATIPKRVGVKPRSDSPDRWTVKTLSQLLLRDYPARN